MNSPFSIGEMCAVVFAQSSNTIYATAWKLIVALWPWYWLLIMLSLGGWIAYEIITRNGTAHYNSDNGFSPVFNSFVGSGMYAVLQALLFFVLTLLFGVGVYCFVWPFAIHVLIFLSTGRLLHAIGFWPRLEQPYRKKRNRRRW